MGFSFREEVSFALLFLVELLNRLNRFSVRLRSRKDNRIGGIFKIYRIGLPGDFIGYFEVGTVSIC